MLKVTSHKFDNEISVLETEINRTKIKLDQMRGTDLELDEAKVSQIADLEEALKQLEFEKHHIETAFSAELSAVLGQVNGKAKAWTVDPDGLIGLAQKIEDLLDACGVRVKNRLGTVVHYRPAGKVSLSQLGKSITTYVAIRRVHDGWRLVRAERDFCFANQRQFREIIVRPAAHEDMIRHATRHFRVWDETPTETPPEGPVS